jgi:hypothetical protein
MRLVERGELDLDRPIREYAPDLVAENPWADEQPVTLAHLLEHTAGYDDMHFNESGSADTPEMSVDEGLAINPRSRTSRWRPGSRMAYANPGTTVAAHVIERVTGESFEAVVQREVLGPLGIAPAAYHRTPALDACLAQGYGSDGLTPLRYWSTPHRPAGHLMLSSRQLGKLVQMFLRRGEGFLTPQSIARMERSGTRAHSIEGLAYGLANYGDFSLPSRARGHDGGLPGFLSQYRYFPELGVGYVILYNTTSNRLPIAHHQIRQRVFRTLTAGMSVEPPAPYVATPEELERWVGSYEPVSPRHEILAFIERFISLRIELREGTLALDLGIGTAIPLVPVGHDQATFPGFSGPMLQLNPDGTLLLGDATYVRRSSLVVASRRQAISWSIRIVGVAPLLLLLLSFGRHRKTARRILVPVALAVGSLWLVVFAFIMAVRGDVLGQVHGWTVTFFVATLLAPATAGLATARSIRALGGRAPWLVRAGALAVALACFVLVVWLRSGHVIGLRTWAW